MGYAYEQQKVSTELYQTILRHVTDKGKQWLEERLQAWQEQGTLQQFNLAFTAAPRFLGREIIKTTDPRLAGYTVDRLFRVWWLLQLPITDQQQYIDTIESLFNSAEMNEQVALYGSLPLLAFPESWTLRTAEGIRSNIGVVLEAIMLHNPYPAKNLDEAAWNQLVMKAFFTDKPVHRIEGLDERANITLARILVDYARERRAAGRRMDPMLWRMVGPFITETNFPDIERTWYSELHAEREAAALACSISNYGPAQALLNTRPEVKTDIAAGNLTWETVANRVNG